MTKTIILSLITLLINLQNIVGQEVVWDSELKSAKMESVIKTDSLTKEQLYEKVKFWTVRKFKSTDNQTLYDDEEKNSIVVTGNIILEDFVCTSRMLNFKMTIIFKEGRLKYIIDEIVLSELCQKIGDETVKQYFMTFDKLYEKRAKKNKKKKNYYQLEVDQQLQSLTEQLKQSLENEIKKPDDW